MSFAGPSAWLVVAAAMAGGVAAAGTPTSVAWSTYLRAAPSQTAPAIDELAHDVPVRVLGCDARWCHVADGTITGYVDRDALSLPRVPPPDAAALGHCTVAALADAPRPDPTRFCDATAR